MAKRNDYAWYKWWPAKALSSARWATLTPELEGIYRRLYDFASLAQPARKRGWLYMNGSPMSLETMSVCCRINAQTLGNALTTLVELGLMSRNTAGVWGFPDYCKHQWHAGLRPRAEGAKLGGMRAKRGRNLGSKRATDVDVDVQIQSTPVVPLSGDGVGEGEKATTAIPERLQQVAFVTFRCVPPQLVEWLDIYAEDDVIEAIGLTGKAGKVNASYTAGILRRWAREGKDTPTKRGGDNRYPF